MVQLTSVLQLFESVAMFAFWHGANTNREPSFWDIRKIFGEYMFFMATIRCDIYKEFYQINSSKHNLDVLIELSNLSRSSFTLSYTLKARSHPMPYARLDFVSICIDMSTRKPCPLPPSVRDMFKNHSLQKRLIRRRMEKLIRPQECQTYRVSIHYTDTDENQHTHWIAYIRACYNACMAGILHQKYECITKDDAVQGIKSFEITFLKESMIEDDLDVISWTFPYEDGTYIAFDVQKGDQLCCQGKLSFHDGRSTDDGKNSKL
ncbi:hypothetical protein FSP39_009083 [Pinctada imbricata]|uniref:Uncharacterized protein n=1 Tax=Pinctada imbricata TaxID=66713 RepID=A0AA88YUN0_PINIB|nr:hypothetical protein FSP39_009083 [Pinctada imbricata]